MEIRVNKLARALFSNINTADQNIEKLNEALGTNYGHNDKLSIVNLNDRESEFGGMDIIDLVELQNKIQHVIDIKQCSNIIKSQLERLVELGVTDIKIENFHIFEEK